MFNRFQYKDFVKPAYIGAAIGYLIITIFLLVPGIEPHPSWPKFWMIRPMVFVPLFGVFGGLFFKLMTMAKTMGKFNGFITVILAVLGFIIAIWVGLILGLDGTLWD